MYAPYYLHISLYIYTYIYICIYIYIYIDTGACHNLLPRDIDLELYSFSPISFPPPPHPHIRRSTSFSQKTWKFLSCDEQNLVHIEEKDRDYGRNSPPPSAYSAKAINILRIPYNGEQWVWACEICWCMGGRGGWKVGREERREKMTISFGLR